MLTTVTRYVYASGRTTQYAYISHGRQRFISEWIALRWERDGKAIIITVNVG